MRIVIVNFSHPQFPHVSSARLYNFGQELAKLGCKVLLLTSNFGVDSSSNDLKELKKCLVEGSIPDFYHVSSPFKQSFCEKLIKSRKTPSYFRKVLVAKNLLFDKGSYIGWQIESKPYIDIISRYFHPTLVWGTFVPLDSWNIAKSISKKSNAKLILDIKDPWGKFIPQKLQVILSRKFSKLANGFTCNAIWQREQNVQYFPKLNEVIYSGISIQEKETKHEINNNAFTITLIGSIYDKDLLIQYFFMLQKWWQSLPLRDQLYVEFIYAGTDWEIVLSTVQYLPGIFMKYTIHKYLPINIMLSVCKTSLVNTYIYSNHCFHHKSIELLLCQKPTMSFPEESDEIINISKSIGNTIFVSKNENTFISNMNQIWQNKDKGIKNKISSDFYTWHGQSVNLYNYFKKVL